MRIIAHVHEKVKGYPSVISCTILGVMNETLAELILRLRTARGWTQEALAERSGLNQPTIADIERGRSKLPGPDIRRRLAVALGVRHVDLLIAAGQLTPDEVAPLPGTHITDPLLADLVKQWPSLDPHLKRFLKDELATVDPVVRRAQAG